MRRLLTRVAASLSYAFFSCWPSGTDGLEHAQVCLNVLTPPADQALNAAREGCLGKGERPKGHHSGMTERGGALEHAQVGMRPYRSAMLHALCLSAGSSKDLSWVGRKDVLGRTAVEVAIRRLKPEGELPVSTGRSEDLKNGHQGEVGPVPCRWVKGIAGVVVHPLARKTEDLPIPLPSPCHHLRISHAPPAKLSHLLGRQPGCALPYPMLCPSLHDLL